MAAKYQLITELYRRTGVSVAKSPQAWQSFLSSACRNYKCRFDEQLLIYAQRPDAVAVAELGTWNKLFKRWVNKDSKGIAVFDPKGRRNTLKYYFDISDTHEGYYGSRPVPIWQMDERYEQAVKERLSDRFGELEETDLAETLFKTAENAVEDNLPDYLSQLKSVTQAFQILKSVKQEGIWATRVSFVYSVNENRVYYVENNDFEYVTKYQFCNSY